MSIIDIATAMSIVPPLFMSCVRHALDETRGNIDVTRVDKSDGVPQDLQLTDHGQHVRRFDHQAVGLGKYAAETLNENHYRQERQMLGATADDESALPGDNDIKLRRSYNKP
jgi:hypothetical protein